ncbi:MAG TPA: TetR/AcrR family transcriptional regulator [Egibacteraceae bacterium]|nr:TetR/AcrR family transcriptional regulator [Egibacteraceae bacterium]
MPRSRSPGQRAGLTRARVVWSARQLLEREGPDALTMRALAHQLGVSPNALYSHVEHKTALIDEILDDALAEVQEPVEDDGDPVAALHAMMTSTFQVLLAHPSLVPLYVARQGARGANARRLGELMLALLERTGVTGTAAREAQRVLIVYAIGFAAFGTRPPLEVDGVVPTAELAGNFDSGLRWLLAGITAEKSQAV